MRAASSAFHTVNNFKIVTLFLFEYSPISLQLNFLLFHQRFVYLFMNTLLKRFLYLIFIYFPFIALTFKDESKPPTIFNISKKVR